jgi:hypothetical protein
MDQPVRDRPLFCPNCRNRRPDFPRSAWNERFCSVFWHRALKDTPETRRAILSLGADITNTKKVRRLAAVCSSFVSTALQCRFTFAMLIAGQKPDSIANFRISGSTS